jgi:hypothetical protein
MVLGNISSLFASETNAMIGFELDNVIQRNRSIDKKRYRGLPPTWWV